MGRKRDLTTEEKTAIVRLCAAGTPVMRIAEKIKRCRTTIKRFLSNCTKNRKRADKGKWRSISAKEITVLKKSLAIMPHQTSKIIFKASVSSLPSKQTRCNILNTIAKVKVAKKKPFLSEEKKIARKNWAFKYMKQNWHNVIFTDECRVNLDGPDGCKRGWVRENWPVMECCRRQQNGGSVLFWMGIHNGNVLGPHIIEGTINSQTYCKLLKDNFLPYYRNLSIKTKKELVYMHDNAPSHCSHMTRSFLQEHGFKNDRLMEWPSNSPDLNPIENFFGSLKSHLYSGAKQFTNKNHLTEALRASVKNLNRKYVLSLLDSMDSRISKIFERKGGFLDY